LLEADDPAEYEGRKDTRCERLIPMKRGIETRQQTIELIKRRLKLAIETHARRSK
jgi:hypothetical protein